MLFEIMKAANYLDIRGLMDSSCKVMTNTKINAKTNRKTNRKTKTNTKTNSKTNANTNTKTNTRIKTKTSLCKGGGKLIYLYLCLYHLSHLYHPYFTSQR